VVSVLTTIIGILIALGTAAAVDLPEPCAEYEFREWMCQIKGNKATLRIHDRLIILNQRGDDYAQVSFFEDMFHKVKDVEITVRDATGDVVATYSKDDLTKSCGFGASHQLYSDHCTYSTTIGRPDYPFSIEYSYRQKISNLFFLRGPRVATDIAVRRAACELRSPVDATVKCKSYGLDMEYSQQSEGKTRTLRWEAINIPAIDSDTVSPKMEHWAGRIVMVTSGFEFAGCMFADASWSGIGKWYADVAVDGLNRSRGFAQEKQNGAIRLAIATAYNRILSDIRYVCVSIGVGGWKPRKPKETQSTGFGDCKDMSTLLVSELSQIGITAYPALILTRDEGYIDTTFPSLEFNHVIAAALVDKDTIWIDPTCTSCPFGDLPWTDENTDVLLITDSFGVLARTPGSEPSDNRTSRLTRVELGQDLSLRLSVVIEIVGNLSHYFRAILPRMSQEEICQLLERWLSKSRVGYQISGVQLENQSTSDFPLQLCFDASTKWPLRPVGDVLYLDPVVFDIGIGFEDADVRDLKHSLEIRYPRVMMDSVVVVWSSELAIDSIVIPEKTEESHSFGHRSLFSWLFDDSAIVVSSCSYDVYEIVPDDFDELLAFETRLRNHAGQRIKFYLGQ